MQLYLVRHADAQPIGGGGAADDAQRPLTALGQQQAHGLAEKLLKQGVTLEAIVTSPLVRARQTAEGIAQGWPQAVSLHVCDDLAPCGKRRNIIKFAKKLGVENIALVGHQPDLEELAAWLIGSRKAQIVIEKAGVAAIACGDEIDKGMGTLGWLLTPQWLGL